jgi:acetylornithine deacetylase/succinyl-diaminopimelate desuccinylase-like protein
MPADHQLLRQTVEALAPIEKAPTSPGERAAADWIAERLEGLGCEVAIEEELAYSNYARPMAALTAIAATAGAVALAGRARRSAALVAAAAAAEIVEDVSNGPRLFRRATMRKRPTWNVVAQTGDPRSERTVVVLAHHDAAPTGRVFDQSLHRWIARNLPGVVEATDTALPLWWPVAAAPAGVARGAARGSRLETAIGISLCLVASGLFVDIARNRIVPGANDNLTAVAAMVALADAFQQRPVEGVRALLVSCGSEETLQGGIHGFLARHAAHLPPDRTWFLNLDTIGAPQLIMLEGEGSFLMEDYHRGFRDFVAGVAQRAGVPLRRGMRARTSTDSVIPSRAGYRLAGLASMDDVKAIPHYHLMSDVPENVHYHTVANATDLAEAVIRELAGGGDDRRAAAS